MIQLANNAADSYHNLLLINDDFAELVLYSNGQFYSSVYSHLGSPVLLFLSELVGSSGYQTLELAFFLRMANAIIFWSLIVWTLQKFLPTGFRWLSLLVLALPNSVSIFSGQGSISEQLNLVGNRLMPFAFGLFLMSLRLKRHTKAILGAAIGALALLNNIEFGAIFVFSFFFSQYLLGMKLRQVLGFTTLSAFVGFTLRFHELIMGNSKGKEFDVLLAFASGYSGGPISPIGPQIWIFPLAVALTVLIVKNIPQGDNDIFGLGVFSGLYTVLCGLYFSNISSLSTQLQSCLPSLSVVLIILVIFSLRYFDVNFEDLMARMSLFPRYILILLALIPLTNFALVANFERFTSSSGPIHSIETGIQKLRQIIDVKGLNANNTELAITHGNIFSYLTGIPSAVSITDPIFIPNYEPSCPEAGKFLVTEIGSKIPNNCGLLPVISGKTYVLSLSLEKGP